MLLDSPRSLAPTGSKRDRTRRSSPRWVPVMSMSHLSDSAVLVTSLLLLSLRPGFRSSPLRTQLRLRHRLASFRSFLLRREPLSQLRPTFKTTITISPEATSTRLFTMTPIRVITVTQTIRPTSPIPTFTSTSTAPPRSIPTFTITSIPTPAEPTLEKPTNIGLTSTFEPPPTLEVPTNIDPTSTFKPSPPPSPTLTSSLNLGPLVPPTTTPTPSSTPIAIPTEESKFSSQLTFPLLPPVTARALHPSHKEVIIELKPDV
ncbi:hypothetical protein QC761_501871 [Podospora bellae-mahoneyi]|uniref:Uncharacterized protein n=1 Tax=Podospora bellae-mahoneyi TaxID=2093777 RepID=A0ABR0FBU0_9PEZI|nr:hypothetical protein QC761_501871 [Podospora bellae-mahoneyi]